MGADNTWSGRVTITPPLTWAECKTSPGIEDVKLVIDEKDGPDGRILTAVAVAPARPGNSWSAHTGRELQFLIDSHPTHEFAGALRVDWDPRIGGDVLAERYTVRGRRVVHESARLAWAEDGDEPDSLAPHRIRIYAHKPWHAPEYTVSHPAACDALPYGPRNDWPDKVRYEATAPDEGESAIRFTTIDEEK